jgi:hypothetical protein
VAHGNPRSPQIQPSRTTNLQVNALQHRQGRDREPTQDAVLTDSPLPLLAAEAAHRAHAIIDRSSPT